MAISSYPLKLAACHLKGAEVLSLGYPELLVQADRIEKWFGYSPSRFTKAPQHGKDFQIPETREFMEKVVKSFECVDVARIQGTERIVDLNYAQDLGEFDFVIDPGTLEHCFNVSQGLLNAAGAVRAGGRIMHISPVSMVNHGFWNFCPTLYHDFYRQNGWTVELLEIYENKGGAESIGSLKDMETSRYQVGPEQGVVCVARRGEKKPFVFPVQSKYKRMLARAA